MIDNTIIWTPGTSLEFMEKQIILAAFRHYRGNKTATANSLGIAIRTLDNKLEKYQQDDKEAEEKQNARRIDREEFIKAQRGQSSTWKPKITGTVRSGNQNGKENEATPASSVYDAASGNGLEPITQVREKRAVPVHVGKEVQEMSFKNNASDNKRKRR